jgi:hypothetical protein
LNEIFQEKNGKIFKSVENQMGSIRRFFLNYSYCARERFVTAGDFIELCVILACVQAE